MQHFPGKKNWTNDRTFNWKKFEKVTQGGHYWKKIPLLIFHLSSLLLILAVMLLWHNFSEIKTIDISLSSPWVKLQSESEWCTLNLWRSPSLNTFLLSLVEYCFLEFHSQPNWRVWFNLLCYPNFETNVKFYE